MTKAILVSGHPDRHSLWHPDTIVVTPSLKFWYDGKESRCSPIVRRMFYALLTRLGRRITTAEFIEILWGDRVDGGPETATIIVRKGMHEVRDFARSFDLRVVNTHGQGYHLAPLVKDMARAA